MMMFSTSGTTFGAGTLGDVGAALKKNITGIQETVENIDKEFSKVLNIVTLYSRAPTFENFFFVLESVLAHLSSSQTSVP